MVKSMTGFGRAEYLDDKRRIIVEIKTVNHRYIDINVKMPRDFIALEERIFKLVKNYISRGKVDIFVTYNEIQTQQSSIIVNEDLVISYIVSAKNIAEKLGIPNDITANSIIRIPDAFTVLKNETDLDEIWKVLQKTCTHALQNVIEMRQREGSAISKDLLDILSSISSYFNAIRVRSPFVPLEYKEKLEARLKELYSDTNGVIDPQRVAMEVAVFADKCCIDEEIARMTSHISQAHKIIAEDGSIGRKLDFLVQEMNREVNTIGSKANDTEITKNVIALKSEIEKLREQIQNVE